MSTQMKMGLASRAFILIKQKPLAITTIARMKWSSEVYALLGKYKPAPQLEPKIDDHPDYQYLQSVIKRELPNMNDPDIGNRMTDILNRNNENPAFISYVQQAIATYREAMISASNQFLWGRA